jgi:hypothetical protein
VKNADIIRRIMADLPFHITLHHVDGHQDEVVGHIKLLIHQTRDPSNS